MINILKKRGVLFLLVFLIAVSVFGFWETYQSDLLNNGISDGTGYFNTRDILTITNNVDGMNYQPLVGDINNNGYNEVIIFSDGYLKIFDQELNLIDEKVVGNLRGQFDIEDMDEDGYIEIIGVVNYNNVDYYQVWEYNNKFNLEQSFSVNSQGGFQEIKCVDFDKDNKKECLYRDYYGIVHSYQIDSNNDELDINVGNGVGSKVNLPPSIVDFDNDGDLDALFWFNDNFTIVDSNKNVVLSKDVGTLRSITSDPSFLGLRFVNLDGAGDYEIAVAWRYDSLEHYPYSYSTDIYLALYNSLGDVVFKKEFDFWNTYPCFNDNHHCLGFGSDFFIVDYDADGYDDIGIYLDDDYYSNYGTYIKIFDKDGNEISSNNVLVEEGSSIMKVSLADMDNDNEKELILQKAIYNLDGTILYNFTAINIQPPIPVDLDKNGGLDLIWTKHNQTKYFIDDYGLIKINNITINPNIPTIKDDLSCSWVVTNTANVNVIWYKNNLIQQTEENINCAGGSVCAVSNKILSSETEKNDIWKCSVVAFIDEKKSFIKSASVTILGSFSEWVDYGNNIQSVGISAGKSILENITKITINEGMNFQTLVGDIDNDNENEIVIFSNNYLKIYNKNLELENEKLVGTLSGQFDLEDMDDDSFIEIVAIVENNGVDNFTIFEYDGNNFKIETTFDVTSQGGHQDIRCLDFDNDNEKECLYRDYYDVVHSYQIDAKSSGDDEMGVDINDGEVIGSNVNLPPTIADFDRDNDLDALFWFNDNFVVVDSNKNIVLNKDVGSLFGVIQSDSTSFLGLKFVNLDRAGDYEIAVAWRNDYGSGASYKTDIYLRLYDSSGNTIFTKTFDFGNNHCYLNGNHHCIGYSSDFFITDYDNDGYDDIGIYLDDAFYSTYGSHIKFFDMYGDEIASNNVDVEENSMIEEIVTLADMDNDDELELILQKSIYDLDGNTIYNFSNSLDEQVPVPVDVDKDGFLDLIWTKEGKTVLFLTNKTTLPEESLLEKYAPVLYFHPDEQFFPTTIYAMLNESDLMEDDPIFDDLIDEMPVALENLTAPDVTDEYYLDMRNASGGLTPSVPAQERFDKYIYIIHGRNFEADNEHIVLQYWFFYPFNHFRGGHEGDWEMIQITLNKTSKEPVSSTYSYHYEAITYNWSEINKVDNTHPKVFVARGGHASYKDDRSIWEYANISHEEIGTTNYILFYHAKTSILNVSEIIDGDSIYSITFVNDFVNWVHFPGRWGDVNVLLSWHKGPNSPANILYGEDQINRWNDPIGFAENAKPSQKTAVTGSPVNLHAYDKEGRHVGLNESGDIEIEIPETYLYVPSDNGKEVIVILTSEEINFVVEATDEGQFNLLISTYDRSSSTEIDLEYEDIQITDETIATINITETNPNFIMQIDGDGDGIIDDTALPDNTTIEGNYTPEETDSDNDGIADSIDNCPDLYNPNQITDFDNDGFDNLLCNGLDCDDSNALINPDAIEECNNIDDNCNNEIDEDLTRQCGVTDIGICTYGVEICEYGNWINCNAILPTNELCNNLDDDCDGLIDEDFDVGEICETGIGECRKEGKKICSEDGLTTICDAVPGEPSKELCDNKDNDCNGIIDNNCARYTKEFTIELLENAKDNKECKKRKFCKDKQLDKVIKNIQKSLDLKYYINDETLNSKQGKDNGQFVFTHELKAVVQCLRGKRFRAIDPVCKDVAEYLVTADKFFAEKALNDAKSTEIINPENKKCFDREINKAEKNIKKADDLLPKKFPSIAINLYKNSWKASQKAINIANSEKNICKKKRWFGWKR